MEPTRQQQDALELYRQGGHMVLSAYAGTGKTTTIRLLARTIKRSGTYLAYNRAIVDDVSAKLADEAPQVKARTAHSLAYGKVGRHFRDRLSAQRINSRDVAKILGIDKPFEAVAGDRHIRLSPTFLAGCVMDGVRQFCNTADPVISPSLLPTVERLDEPGKTVNDEAYRAYLAPALARAWDDLSHPTGALRFSHDCYLKLWQLGFAGNPVIPGDVVFLDEAQDVNPVILDVVRRSTTGDRAQLVAVGDTFQQIYAWRGAVNAIGGLLALGAAEGRLTQSFRFGPEIAEAGMTFLSQLGAPARLVGLGEPGRIGHHERPDAILCRSNAGVISALMSHLATRRCAVVGGTGDLIAFARGMIDLAEHGRSSHPELVCFSSIDELQTSVADDPSSSDLALRVRLCVLYGADAIIDALSATVPEQTPGALVLSTAHRAKGREWPVVRLGSDFSADRAAGSPDEGRLAYVAVTRARSVLDDSETDLLAVS